MDRITVLVADTQMLFADSLADALGILFKELDVLAERPLNGADALEVIQNLQPDVALADMWLAEMEGPALAASARARGLPTKVVLLAWFHGPEDVDSAATAGAAGVVPKDAALEVLAAAVRTVHASGTMFLEPGQHTGPGGSLPTDTKPGPGPEADVWQMLMSLTPREIQILKLMSLGYSVDDMVEPMSLKRSTVQTHIRNVLRKTASSSQLKAVALARRYGIIPP